MITETTVKIFFLNNTRTVQIINPIMMLIFEEKVIKLNNILSAGEYSKRN
jgi:hypothetical protein